MIMPDFYTLTFIAACAVCVLLIVFICITVSNSVKLKRILRNCKNGNLEQTITEYYDKLEHTAESMNALSAEFNRYENDNRNALQCIGIVNFDAYNDISGRLSFSVAMINRRGNGFILTSLYGHETSNVYIRRVHEGVSDTHLFAEETEALERAFKNTEGFYNE